MNEPMTRESRIDVAAAAMHAAVCPEPETCCWAEEGTGATCAEVDLTILARAVADALDAEAPR